MDKTLKMEKSYPFLCEYNKARQSLIKNEMRNNNIEKKSD